MLVRSAAQEGRRTFGFFHFFSIIGIAFLIITPFRFYVAQPFTVSGASMEPTLGKGEYLVIDELTYRFEQPARGDVVIFRYPLDTDVYFVKRIIGLPGETVEIREGVVYIHKNGTPIALEEPYVPSDARTRESSLIKLGANEYFVLGDNREASTDSRIWGPLPADLIVGRAFMRLLPLQDINMLPGKHVFQKNEVPTE